MRPPVIALSLILLLGLGLRCVSLTAPLLDMHAQRQIDTAAMARSFVEDSFNPLYPQVSWGGRPAYVESEFPVLPLLAALPYKLFGESETIGRALAVAFSLGALWAMYRLAAALYGPAAGRAAAFLLAVSPTAVYYGRTYMPEAPMLCFAIMGVMCFVRYFQDGRRVDLWLGAAATGLAWLAKLPAIVTLAPIVAFGWSIKGRRVLRDREFIVALAAALLLTAAWYWHASNIFHATGLTVGLHPPKSYPPAIAPGPWAERSPKWSTLSLLGDRTFYDTLLRWIFFLHLTPAGFAIAAVGLVLCPHPGRRVADLWMLAMLAFILATAEVNRWHDYYQLLIVPPAALYFGWAAAPVFDGPRISRNAPGRRYAVAAVGAALTIVALLTFEMSGILASHFRIRDGVAEVARAGHTVERTIGRDELLIVVDGFGVNSPYLLYSAHARGWSFDPPSLTPQVIDTLRRRGARYFVTTRWKEVTDANPLIAGYLGVYRQIALPDAPRDCVLVDLAQRR